MIGCGLLANRLWPAGQHRGLLSRAQWLLLPRAGRTHCGAGRSARGSLARPKRRPRRLPALLARPPAAVEHAQPEFIYYRSAQRVPNDPLYQPGDFSSGQWYLPQVWAPTAWATTVGSKAIKVCVVSWQCPRRGGRLLVRGSGSQCAAAPAVG